MQELLKNKAACTVRLESIGLDNLQPWNRFAISAHRIPPPLKETRILISAAVLAMPDFIKVEERTVTGFETFPGAVTSTSATPMSTRVRLQTSRLV